LWVSYFLVSRLLSPGLLSRLESIRLEPLRFDELWRELLFPALSSLCSGLELRLVGSDCGFRLTCILGRGFVVLLSHWKHSVSTASHVVQVAVPSCVLSHRLEPLRFDELWRELLFPALSSLCSRSSESGSLDSEYGWVVVFLGGRVLLGLLAAGVRLGFFVGFGLGCARTSSSSSEDCSIGFTFFLGFLFTGLG
jgi:hypothetical protein